MKITNNLGTPAGLKDLLPREAALKRRLSSILAKLFSAWGYKEIVTPSLEYYHTLSKGLGNDDAGIHKMIDRSGKILALRSDMTNPIARLVSSRFQNEPLPLRFFYLANVFRYETELQKGKQREFYQAGVEFLGIKNSQADAEVILLAIESLEKAGLNDFEIGLGHVEITKSLLRIICPDEEGQKRLQEALTAKNYVAVDNILATATSAEVKKIKELLTRQWRDFEIIEHLKKIASEGTILEAISNLEQVISTLKTLGLSKRVFIDLSILRDFNYYTGVVFEGYSTSLGYPLLGGGRYDKLLGNFGFNCPATGFALGLERVMAVLPQTQKETLEKIDYLLIGQDYVQVCKKAQELRKNGYRVEIDPLGRNMAEAEEYALKKGIRQVLEVAGDRDE